MVLSAGDAEGTILDGGGIGTVLTIMNGADSVVEGLTITNGVGAAVGVGGPGGGISIIYSSPTLINLLIVGNNGPGVYTEEASPNITGGKISENTGDGIRCNSSFPLPGGGSIPSPSITGCDISFNGGSGIFLWTSSPGISGCRFTGNGGGGISGGFSSPTVTSSFISGNTSDPGGGGGSFYSYSEPVIINCTIADNSGGGLYCTDNSFVTVINTILWNNTTSGYAEIYVDGTSSTDVTYSDVEGGWPGERNKNENPEFVDNANGDYHLNFNSPCFNEGTLNRAPEYDFEDDPRLESVGGDNEPDIGADEYVPSDLLPILDIYARPKDGKVDVVWTPVPGAVSYDIYRRVDGEHFQLIQAGHVTDYAVYANFGLTNGVTYHYVVIWVNDNGVKSPPSNETSATPVSGRTRRR